MSNLELPEDISLPFFLFFSQLKLIQEKLEGKLFFLHDGLSEISKFKELRGEVWE